MKHKIKITLLFMFFLCKNTNAQVTVGNNEEPVKGAILQLKNINDVKDGAMNADKGLLLPRVELVGIQDAVMKNETQQTDFSNEKNTHVGLVVYNVTDKPEINLCPGMYVWTGDNKWNRLLGDCTPPCQPISSENSFIVSPTSTTPLLIPVGKPYLVWKDRSDLGNKDIEGKVSVSLLWQDKPSLIKSVELADGDKGACSEIKVTTAGNGTLGNALVAVHVGSNGDMGDPIYWSWHIWVSDNVTSLESNNGDQVYAFMDRNLGATTTTKTTDAMGLMYQWGRKDPFTASSSFMQGGVFRQLYDINNNILTEINEGESSGVTGTGIHHMEVTATNNLSNSLNNPTTFYYGSLLSDDSQNSSDWYTVDQTGAIGDDNLWGADGQKSVFDPCPEGWRIPLVSTSQKSPWANYEEDPIFGQGVYLQIDTYGFQLDNIGYYPYSNTRKPRAYKGNCSFVGGSTDAFFVGGVFDWCAIQNDYSALYWIGNSVTNTTNAKANSIMYSGGFGYGSFTSEEVTKSTGGSVRCVKIK